MDGKRDLRVQKTYMALFQAFEQLLQEKSFDDITVKELCERAMVRTATFYTHFPDKLSFLSFMIEELRSDYSRKVDDSPAQAPEDYYLNILKTGLGFLEENSTLIRAMDSNADMNVIFRAASDVSRENLVRHLKEDQREGALLSAEPELLAELYIGAVNRIGRWWLADPDRESAGQFAERMRTFVRRMIGRE